MLQVHTRTRYALVIIALLPIVLRGGGRMAVGAVKGSGQVLRASND